MNERENIFGSLENIEPVTNTTPDTEANTSIFGGESNVSFTEMPVNDSIDSVPMVDNTYMEEPIAPVAPLDDQVSVAIEEPTSFEQPAQATVEPVTPVEVTTQDMEVDPASSMSYTEIPVASVTDNAPERRPERPETVNENPNGKVTLRREEQDLPEIKEPSEAVDKETIWLLVWLFVGMLAVILALPYVSQLI